MVVSLIAAIASNMVVSINESLLKDFPTASVWLQQKLEGKSVIIDHGLDDTLAVILKESRQTVTSYNTVAENELSKQISTKHFIVANKTSIAENISVENIDDALMLAKSYGDDEIVVIVNNWPDYAKVLAQATQLYLFHADLDISHGYELTNFAPEQWQVISTQFYDADENNLHNYCFETLARITN